MTFQFWFHHLILSQKYCSLHFCCGLCSSKSAAKNVVSTVKPLCHCKTSRLWCCWLTVCQDITMQSLQGCKHFCRQGIQTNYSYGFHCQIYSLKRWKSLPLRWYQSINPIFKDFSILFSSQGYILQTFTNFMCIFF